MASSDETAVTELIIDASQALPAAAQTSDALDKVAESSQQAAGGMDQLGESVDRTTTTVTASAREIRQQASAVDQFRASVDPAFTASQNLEKASTSLELAQAGLTRQMQTGAISVAQYETELAALKGRQTDLSATSAALRAGQISVADAMTALKSPAQQATEAQAAQAAEQMALADAAGALRDKLDPISVAQRTYGASVANADSLLKASLITEAEHAAALKLAQAALDDFASGNDHATNASSKMREGLVLVHELLTGNYKRAVGSATLELQNFGLLSAIFNPMVIGAVAMVAAFAAAAVAGVQFSNSELALTRSFTSVGGVIGVQRNQLDDLAKSSAAAGDISVSSARGLEQAYIATGQVGGQNLKSLITATGVLANATGEDLATAEATIAKIIQDPIKAAQELTQQYGLLTQSQMDQVRILQDSGDKMGAAKVVSDALSGSLQKQQGFWEGIGKSISNAWTALGQFAAGPTNIDQKIQAATTAQGNSSRANYVAYYQQQIDALNKLKAAQDATDASQQKLTADNRAAANIDALTQSIDGNANALQLLLGKQAQYNNYVASGHTLTAEQQKGYDAVTSATVGYLTPLEKVTEQTKIDTQVAGASAGARDVLRARLEAELKVRGEMISPAQKEAEVDQAVTKAVEAQTTAISDRTAQLSLDMAGSINSAKAYLQGATQGVQADALRQASLEQLANSQVSLTQAQNEAIDEYVKKQIDAGSQTVTSVNQQVAAQQNLLAASTQGVQAEHGADVQNQITAATQDLLIAKNVARTQSEKDTTQALIDHITQQIQLNDVDKQQTDYNLAIDAEKQKIALLQQEYAAGAQLKGQQDTQIAAIQAEIDLKKQIPGLSQPELDAYGQLIAQQTKLTNEISQQKQAEQAVASTVSSGLSSLFENTFENVFEHGLKGFQGFGDDLIQLFAQVAAKIAEELIINAALNLSVNESGGGTTGTISSGISALGTGSSLLSGGSSLSLFGAAADSSLGGSGLGLGAAQGAGAASGGGSLLGGGSSGLLAGAGSVVGGAALGYGVGSVVTGVTGSHVAGDVLGGAAAGLVVGGPIGAVAGAVIGGVIAAFSQPPQNNDGVAFIGSNHGNGTLHLAGTTSDHQDVSGAVKIAQQEVKDVNSFAAQYGLKVAGPGNQDLGIGIGPNANPAYAQTEAGSIQKLLANHDFSSSNKAVNNLLKSSDATDLSTLAQQIQAVEQGASALSATLGLSGHSVDSLESSMKTLDANFQADKASAETYGFTIAQVTKGYGDAFNTAVNDQLLSTYNAKQAALNAESRDAATQLDVAKDLGANLVNVEKLNAAERLAVFEQYDGMTVAALRTSLTATGHDIDSVESSMTATIATFNAAVAAAKDFGSVANSNSPTAAQVQATYASQFNTSISDQLLGINDPEQLALEQQARDAAAQLAAAKKLGADINQVEALNAAERLAIIKQYSTTATETLADATSSLTTEIHNLQFGSSSALTTIQQLRLAQEQENYIATHAAAGNLTDAGNLPSYVDTLLTAAKAEYGSTAAYTAVYNKVMADLQAAKTGIATPADTATQSAQMIAKATVDSGKKIVDALNLVKDQIVGLRSDGRRGRGKPAGLNQAA
jgi:hypothetical protein